MDYFIIYLFIINILSFMINSLDIYLYLNKHKQLKYIVEIFIILGGVIGVIISMFFFDRHINKRTLFKKLLALCFTIIEIIILIYFYGPNHINHRLLFLQFLNKNIVLFIYLLFINSITFFIYALDKKRAVNDQWRIKEVTLLGLSLIGGSLGALLAMYSFKHKTKKFYFCFLVPLMLFGHIILVNYLLFFI